MSTVIVTLADIPSMCARIADLLCNDGHRPDHVLYIERGGRLLGQELAKRLRCSCSGIEARRRGGRLKSLLLPLFARLPVSVAHELRRLELRSGVHRRSSDRQVRLPEPLSLGVKSVVVIDDAVDTGHSLMAVVKFLESSGFSRAQISTAAVTVTGENIVYTPDVALYNVLVTFPWSAGARDQAECEALMSAMDGRR